MKIMKINFTAMWIVLFLLTAAAALAQTTAFSYQGLLTEAGNPSVNGTRFFRFTLFDENGTAIPGASVEQTLTVTNGVFNTSLDFGAANFTGANRSLQIEVKINAGDAYTLLNPRQEILAAPYSIKSRTADNSTQLGGLDSTRFVQQDAGGNVSIGGNLTVSGTATYNTVNAQTQFNLGGNRILSAAGSNLFAGFGAGGDNTTGQFNSFFGIGAGRRNTIGSSNVFVGDAAGGRNTAGTGNSFVGSSAGAENTTGTGNSFFGNLAGQFNTTGSNNSFFGRFAGQNNTASGNSFFGFEAGLNNTADDNSFFGYRAGRANTTGDRNSFFGIDAGLNNTTGCCNSFFGNKAGLLNTIGRSNVFLGGSAGNANTEGGNNTFVGDLSGTVNAIGSNNVTLGFLANFGSNNLNFASAFGSNSVVNSSDTIVLGKIAGTYNGVARPADKVEIPGSGLVSGTFGVGITPSATWRFEVNGDSRFYTSSGGEVRFSSPNAESGMTVFRSGNRADVRFEGTTLKLVTGLTDNPPNSLNGLAIDLNGRVGIGTLTPASKLTVTGLIETTTGGVKFPDGTIQTSAFTGTGNSFILNQTALQASANFNIAGTGTANIFNALTQFNQNGNRVLRAVDTGAGLGGNLYIGFGAGANTTPGNPFPFAGTSNTFIGAGAGNLNVSGAGNTFVGTLAGENNTANNNTFFGGVAGRANTTGTDNAYFGAGAGLNNATGRGNSFFGSAAGSAGATGDYNSFFGLSAGSFNTGNNNSFFGRDAGIVNSTGGDNSFFGKWSGLANSTGAANTFVGKDAGAANTVGSNNTLVGANSNVGANNLTNATAIGAGATVSQNDSVVLGNNANVGIGTSTPKTKLDVTGGNILVGSPGQGIVLKSPDGATCRLLSIDNAGAMVLTAVVCP